MVKVLKKLYVHFRSKGSDVGDLGHDALEDIENDQGEELVIENMDDEPIIISIKDLPSPGEGIAMKAEDVEAIEDTKDKPEVVTERAQATEDIESKPEVVTERAQAAEEIESKVPVAVEMAQAAEDIERKPEVAIEMAQAAEDTESKPVVGIEMAQAVEDIKSKPPVASEMVQALELIEDSQMPFQAVERDVVLVEESQHIDPDPAQVVETQTVKKCQTLPMHMEIDLPGLASSSVEDVAALKALDFVPYSIRIKQFFDKWPGSKAPVNLSSSSSTGQECLKIESEPTLPAEKEPGLAEKQARLRKDLKAKAKEDERQKQEKKIQKQLAAEEKKRKKAEPKRRSRKASAAPAAEEPVVAAEPKRRSRKAAAAPDAEAEHPVNPAAAEPKRKSRKRAAPAAEAEHPVNPAVAAEPKRKSRKQAAPAAEAEHPVNPVAAAEPKRKSRKQAAPATEAETEADHLVNLVVAAEPKRKSRKRDAPPVPASAAAEEAEANDVDSSLDAASFVAVAEDLKTEKVRKAFGLLMASNIPALEVPLAGRKSYTVKPKPGAPPFARPIGVVLYSSSFYVGKVALPQDSWPEECRKFYKVDVKNGVTIPWYKASSPVESELNKIRTAWKHAMVLGGWIDP
ncbi:unnamed protein product [Durusdinium trenchii]|uniref:Uncharacterized protein n=1 Tax=Durusdinium trenchii TaxID=1381693 RepID=A0ABP0HLS0_9DINO